MANYVANKVICTKSFFYKYLLDPCSLGEDDYEYCKKHKYISFNKLVNVNDINEYYQKYGTYIDYGYFYTLKEIENNLVEVKFKTRWYYPISAILKAIELEHDIIWYCVEENCIYISKFLWKNNNVLEEVLDINADEFDNFYNKYNIKCDGLADDIIWYFKPKNNIWTIWQCDDLIKKYKNNYPFKEYYKWLNK